MNRVSSLNPLFLTLVERFALLLNLIKQDSDSKLMKVDVIHFNTTLFDHLIDYIVAFSDQGLITYCNESFANLIGKAPKRIVGKHIYAFFEPCPSLEELLNHSVAVNLDQYFETELRLRNGSPILVNLHRKKIDLEHNQTQFLLTLRDLTVESGLHTRYRAQLAEKEALIERLDIKIFELQFILELLSISLKNSDNEYAKDLLFETIVQKIPAKQVIMMSINPNSKPYQIKVIGHYQGNKRETEFIENDLMNLLTSKINLIDFQSQTESIELPIFEVSKNDEFLGIIQMGKDLGWYFFGFRFDRKETPYFKNNINFLKAITQQTLMILENQMLYMNSITDDRTKLYNHRYFEYRFDYELKKASRQRTPLSFLIIDIDHFKKINDEHGHQEGDAIIKKIAQVFREHFRSSDILARFGGDEFVVILPETPLTGSLVVAERLVEKVRSIQYRTESGMNVPLSISIGISCYPHHGNSVQDLLESADRALYQTKSKGRNGFSWPAA